MSPVAGGGSGRSSIPAGTMTGGNITSIGGPGSAKPGGSGGGSPGGNTGRAAPGAAVAFGAITAQRKPAKLTRQWFFQVPMIIDPADGTRQSAYTGFDWELPDLPPRMVGPNYAFAIPNTLTITPDAKIEIGTPMTTALLAHERFHYDAAFVVARRLAFELEQARAPSIAELRVTFVQLLALHFEVRLGDINERYDRETKHGLDPYFQNLWLERMTACLGNPGAMDIAGMRL